MKSQKNDLHLKKNNQRPTDAKRLWTDSYESYEMNHLNWIFWCFGELPSVLGLEF